MRKPKIRPDMELSFRMFFSLFLLAALYLAFLAVLWHIGLGFLPMVVIAGGMLLVQYYYSDKMVLASMGARIVTPQQEPELYDIIEKLAVLADLPVPKVAIVDSDMPNAFATGRNPQHAVVAVTTGIMRRLNQEELQAVLGHELTHIKNRDMAVITLASFFASVASFILQFAMWGGLGWGGNRRQRDDVMLVYLASLAVWAISFFLIRALSRYREFAADRGGAILTGAPSQLSSALIKISDSMQHIPNTDLRQAEAFNAFFIIPALRRDSLMELMATHPSLQHRLNRLERIAADIER